MVRVAPDTDYGTKFHEILYQTFKAYRLGLLYEPPVLTLKAPHSAHSVHFNLLYGPYEIEGLFFRLELRCCFCNGGAMCLVCSITQF